MTAKSQELINFGSFHNSVNPLLQSSNPENIFSGKAFPLTCSIQPQSMKRPLHKPVQEATSNLSNTEVSDITGNIFLDGSHGSDTEMGNEYYLDGNSDLGSQHEPKCRQMSDENHGALLSRLGKNNSFQNVSNSVDYFNQNAFIKRRSQARVKQQTSSNEYYKNYSVTDKEYASFTLGLKKKLKHWTRLLTKETRMKPAQFWGQKQGPPNTLVPRDRKLEERVRQQSNQVQLNLQVIINRSNDPNMIKNRYLVEGHIAESTFSNTFRVKVTSAKMCSSPNWPTSASRKSRTTSTFWTSPCSKSKS